MHLNVRAKLLGLSAILIAFMGLMAGLWIYTLGQADALAGEMNVNVVQPLNEIGIARAKFNENRGYLANHLLESTADKKKSYEDKIAANDTTIDENLAKFQTSIQSAQAKADFKTLSDAITAYRTGRTQVYALSSAGDQANAYKAIQAVTRPQVDIAVPAFQSLFDSKVALGNTYDTQIGDTAGVARLLAILTLLIVAAVGFALSWFVSGRVVKGLAQVQGTLGMLADKCATWLAEGMEKFRDGDLTYAVTPVTPLIEHYGTDEIGKLAEYTNALRNKIVASIGAYNDAREGLTGTITEVQEAADSVSRTSEQLTEAASQTGAATQQVATTISQVAGGTAEQARAASDTNAAVQELSGVIAQVGSGTVEASRSVERSLAAVGSMQAALTADSSTATLMRAMPAALSSMAEVTLARAAAARWFAGRRSSAARSDAESAVCMEPTAATLRSTDRDASAAPLPTWEMTPASSWTAAFVSEAARACSAVPPATWLIVVATCCVAAPVWVAASLSCSLVRVTLSAASLTSVIVPASPSRASL